MADLDPILQVELLKWREAQRVAEKDGRAAAEREAIAGRVIRAHIATDLDDAALAKLGVKVSSRLGSSVIGEVALRDAERLARAPGVKSVTPGQPFKPDLDGSVKQIRAPTVWSGTPSYKGRGVIVGVIDTGIDIFHDSFRKADRTKSRILSIWDQRAAGAAASHRLRLRRRVPRRTQIETALAVDVAHPGTATFPHVDGEFVGGAFVETGGHGTHVSSIAAGDGSPDDTCDDPFTFVGVAPEADIIVVACVFDDTFVREAVQYIFDCATALNRGSIKPAVINMSFGWNLGPHDGSYPLEADLDALLNPGGDACSGPRHREIGRQ